MDIQNNTNINFGQLIPTKPLLKSALKIHDYDEGKALSLSITTKFPGNIGYYKRAINIADNIISKNPELEKINEEIKQLPQQSQAAEIDKFVNKLGKNIDINI